MILLGSLVITSKIEKFDMDREVGMCRDLTCDCIEDKDESLFAAREIIGSDVMNKRNRRSCFYSTNVSTSLFSYYPKQDIGRYMFGHDVVCNGNDKARTLPIAANNVNNEEIEEYDGLALVQTHQTNTSTLIKKNRDPVSSKLSMLKSKHHDHNYATKELWFRKRDGKFEVDSTFASTERQDHLMSRKDINVHPVITKTDNNERNQSDCKVLLPRKHYRSTNINGIMLDETNILPLMETRTRRSVLWNRNCANQVHPQKIVHPNGDTSQVVDGQIAAGSRRNKLNPLRDIRSSDDDCTKGEGQTQAIRVSSSKLQEALEDEENKVANEEHYDRLTWRMYHRITTSKMMKDKQRYSVPHSDKCKHLFNRGCVPNTISDAFFDDGNFEESNEADCDPKRGSLGEVFDLDLDNHATDMQP